MKSLFCFLLFIGTSILLVKAQDKEKSVNSWRKVNPEIKVPMLDTVMVKIRGLNNVTNRTISPVLIPNAFEKMDLNTGYHAMPILKLNGQNLAPMPGTENLNYPKDTVLRTVKMVSP